MEDEYIVLRSFGIDGKRSNGYYSIGDQASINQFIQDHDGDDIYYSPNSFKEKKTARRADLLHLNSLFLDFDKEGDHNPIELDLLEEIAHEVDCILTQNGYPPSKIIFSGRGLHLYWTLSKTKATNESIQQFTKTQHALGFWINRIIMMNPKLNDSGIKFDEGAVTPERIIRVEGTVNTKVNLRASVLVKNDVIYNLNDFYQNPELQLDISPPKKSKDTQKNNHKSHKSTYTEKIKTWREAILRDLDHLQLSRTQNYVGRDWFLFTYGIQHYALYNDEKLLLEQLVEKNKNFNPMLKQYEIRKIVRAVIKGNIESGYYKLSRAKMICWLGIDEDEQKSMEAIFSKEESKNRKRDRFKKYRLGLKLENKRKKELLIDCVNEKLDQGFTQVEVSRMFGISDRTVRNYKNRKKSVVI